MNGRGMLRGGVTVACGLLVAVAAGAGPRGALREVAPPLVAHAELARGVAAVVPGAAASSIVPGGRFFPQSVASGDPRPDSVVLWTRVNDPSLADADLPVRVIVTRDRFFHHVVVNRVVLARAAHDHCVKLKIGGLEPATSYIYLFVYYHGGDVYLSRPGRTRTAPAPGSDVPVRFALFSGQQYLDRYYNAFAETLLAAGDEIDFVVHVGDYVYETSGGDPGGDRWFAFSDGAGAINLGGGTQAAASLSNYRQLYKTYRSDPMLQRLHERYPMIAVWDDHEYADDCWGATATYFGGRVDERDGERRRRAERAYLEYMPIDRGLDESGTLAISDADLYPNARIYRDLVFGANLHLVMTDYRSFRPDHLIPEDAFPGRIVIDRAILETVLGAAGYAAVAPRLDPYFDADAAPALQAGLVAILTQAYMAANPSFDAADAAAAAVAAASGTVSATYTNAAFAAAGLTPPFDAAALAAMDRGLSYLFLGKQALYGRIGARYMVLKDTFELYAKFMAATTGGAAQDAYGPAQRRWLAAALAGSQARWRVIASSVSLAPLILDFTNPVIAAMLPPDFPNVLRTRLLVNVDHWDGFPDARRQLLGALRLPNTVLVSGDIHASFVTDHGGGLFEFTGAAVSSASWEEEVLGVVASDPTLSSITGIEQLVAQIGTLFKVSSSDPAVSDSRIVDAETGANGFVVVAVDGERLLARYFHIDAAHAHTSYYDDPEALAGLFTTTTWKVEGGQLSQQQ